MDSNTVITAMIVVCITIVALMVMAKPLAFAVRFIINAAVGCVVITFINAIFGSVIVGVNPLTAAFIGILGAPGLGAILIIGALL